AADAHLQLRAPPAAFPRAHLYELPDTLAIEHLEGILLEDAELDIARQERRRVIARDAERRLGEVVRAEREELRMLRNLRRKQCSARQLDHRSDHVRDLDIAAAQ